MRSIKYMLIVAVLISFFVSAGSVFCAVKKKHTNKKAKNKMNIYIETKISEQKLYVMRDNQIWKEYPVSTSKYGVGNESGSNKTPLGKHKVREKFGAGAPINTIFKSRENTKKIAEISIKAEETGKDLVTSRILWLEGTEDGINKGNGIDSYLRNIYIHGTSEEGLIGTPASHGCIRMKNKDVIELFDLIPIGTQVEIKN